MRGTKTRPTALEDKKDGEKRVIRCKAMEGQRQARLDPISIAISGTTGTYVV